MVDYVTSEAGKSHLAALEMSCTIALHSFVKSFSHFPMAGPSRYHPSNWYHLLVDSLTSIESRTAHFVILILVLLDCSVTFTRLSILVFDPTTSIPGTEHILNNLALLNWIFLGLYVGELVLKLVVFGVPYFVMPLHAVDAATVVVMVVLRSVMRAPISGACVGLLVLMRLWRIVRLPDVVHEASFVYGGKEVAYKDNASKVVYLNAKLNASKEKNQTMERDIVQLEAHMEELQHELDSARNLVAKKKGGG
jgi:hypothetical protein